MNSLILTCNAGSSNIKLALFDSKSLARIQETQLRHQKEALEWIHDKTNGQALRAIGHRVVHGGREFTGPVRITSEVMQVLNALCPLAPLHQPHNLALIDALAQRWPDVAQIACFDTAFHASLSELERRLPLPAAYHDEGIMRYGFHGISYQSIASALSEQAAGKTVVAHLGNGSSMCAMENGKSVATTMGFSTLDGLMMGTRPGALDAGVLLYLLQQKHMPIEEVETLLYYNSGLKGVSGISHDMRELIASYSPDAKEAIVLYCRQAARELGMLLMMLGGIDRLVFTGGIGEHCARARQDICAYAAWLGVTLDPHANADNAPVISTAGSPIPVMVIPTDEEKVIAQETLTLLSTV